MSYNLVTSGSLARCAWGCPEMAEAIMLEPPRGDLVPHCVPFNSRRYSFFNSP